jgi:hypothetical protein
LLPLIRKSYLLTSQNRRKPVPIFLTLLLEYCIDIMVLRAELPKTLIAANFERYDPSRQGGRVPIRFVPEAVHVPDEKSSRSSTVKFKISTTVEKTFKVLIEGGTEAFINHIKVHKTIMADCKVQEQAVAARALLTANRVEIAALTLADALGNQEEINNLVEANRELAESVRTLIKDAFDYFEKILSPVLAVKWQLIVEEEVNGVDYVSLTGTKPGIARGRDFTALNPCYYRFVKLVAPQDAAERLKRYMNTNMILNTEKGITIEMGVGRVIELNDALPYLPCLKHKEGAPTEMTAMNVKYTEVELCTIVLHAVNLRTSTAYYASVQNEFPTDLTRLTQQLTRVCDQNKEHKRLLNDLASRMGVKVKDGPGSRGTMNSATEAIPRKQKGNGKRGGETPAASSSAKRGGDANSASGQGCTLCKKYSKSPNAWLSHSTSSCKKYNGDGTFKPFKYDNGKDGEPLSGRKRSQFAILKKEAKSAKKKVRKMKKKLKHVKKRGKPKTEYYSSSSSSSSDSDSE